jgi:hypothetical protein
MKAVILLCLLFAASTFSVLAFTDDFNDGDDEGWTRLDPLGEAGIADPVEISFPDGGYQLKGSIPPIADAGPSRVFSYLNDEMFSDFYSAVDIVAWEEINQAFGIVARGSEFGLGTTIGYVCNYNPTQSSGQPTGQFQINYVEGEAAPSDSTMAAANIELIQGHSYRLVFMGKGLKLTGALYDLLDLTKPVSLIETEDDDFRSELYPTGFVGLFNFFRGDATAEAADTTFDNFFREVENPHADTWPSIGPDIPGQPYLSSLTPASGENFATAAGGLNCTIAPGGESPMMPASVSLELNGVDVTTDLSITEIEGGGVQVAFPGLEAGTNYAARLKAPTAAGGELEQRWLFDTFSNELLADAVVIEVEDYNFESGKFNAESVPGSYIDKFGEVDIDYLDFDGSAHSEYRFEDFVGMHGIQLETPPEILNDTLRSAFTAVGEEDYAVNRTEAGEWMNYTRDFPPADYEVYLRTACLADQEVLFDLITSDPTKASQTTSPLGAFKLTSTVGGQNFAYFQLTDDLGSPASPSLAGMQTLRLTIGGDDQQFETKFSLMMNYLVFIPGSKQPFHITSISYSNEVGVTISWPSVSNRSYAVEFSETLLEQSWIELSDIVATDKVTSYTDPTVKNGAKRFGYYRVQQTD